MNNQQQQAKHNNRAANDPPGFFFFKADSMLCGALGGTTAGSEAAAVGTYGMSTEALVRSMAACGGDSDNACIPSPPRTTVNNSNKVPQVIVKPFQPHMCEDRDFFVIDGSGSVDLESLSVPSMGDMKGFGSDGSDASDSLFKLDASPARSKKSSNSRESAPSSFAEQHGPILEDSVETWMPQGRDTSPQRMSAKPGSKERKKQIIDAMMNPERATTPVTPQMKGVGNKQSKPQIIKAEVSKVVPPSPEKDYVIDEERLRQLIAPPKKEVQINATDRFVRDVQAYIPSCQGDLSNQPKEETLLDPATLFWKEKFSEAATKVIQQSSARCIEIVDPTIPRASDVHRARQQAMLAHQQQLQGRNRYRKVLKKYRKHRLLVLIMDPSTKLYEMLELPYRRDETTVADVLIMARIQTTDERLRYKEYVGLCRPNLNPPPPPPPPRQNASGSAQAQPVHQTPPRYPHFPPKVNRVTHMEEKKDDDHLSMASEVTTNTCNQSHSCMLQEITSESELVWNLLSPSRPTSSLCSSLSPQLALALPIVTLPLLGDIVVTIPKGYSGEEVSKFALSILQTPLFLRWVQNRYLNDLQKENDELLSRADAAVGGGHTKGNNMRQEAARLPPAQFEVYGS